jgi:iron-sulfur cluster assembly accessory protein
MSVVESFDPSKKDPVEITLEAAKKIKFLIDDEDDSSLKLRVFVTGGGCSGFQYGFTFEDKVEDDDTVVLCEEIGVVIDPLSLQYLDGAIIELKEELMGTQFVINNPNAKTTCGCGSSFGI